MEHGQKDFLIHSFSGIGVKLTDRQIEQFLLYFELLAEWNEKINLTAITDYEDVVIKHFVDSVAAVRAQDFGKVHYLLDLGTGAGFPGSPLKIVYPHLWVVLMDSLNKRIIFLQEVIARLGLDKIEAVHGRAEDMARLEKYREKQDMVVSRAVANMSTLLEYCMPFVRPGGLFISYKSGKYQDELEQSRKACAIMGGKLVSEIPFTLPGTDIDRSFIVFKKTKKISKKFPRRAGLPGKQPLGS